VDVAEGFDAFVGRADSAMVVVTVTAPDGARHGCLVGFHTQVSIESRRHLVLLSHANATYRAAVDADRLGVHLLGPDSHDLARLFGAETADDGVDKFATCAWSDPGDGGPPLLDDAVAWFVGRILEHRAVGDHSAFLLAPDAAGGTSVGPVLRLGDVDDLAAGH
jgi:flavin reductase (DIM6/NTAB) family NADH-FMN oxidoreductase RutF